MINDSLRPVGFNRDRLLALMKQKGLDGIFFSSPENVFYTTGYPALPSSGNPIIYALRNQLPFFSFLGKDGKVTLISWGGASMGIDYEVDDIRMIFMQSMVNDELAGVAREKLPENSHLGVDSTFPFFALEVIKESAKPAAVVNADDLIYQTRIIKTPAEIERIKKSTEIIDKTVMELADALKLGMSRLELTQLSKTLLFKNGADWVDHITMAFGGANPEVALGEPLEKDQIVTLDLGAFYQGYVSDNRRLVYTGKIPAELKELHQKLCGIVSDMGKFLLPGKTFGEVNAHAYELYAAAGIDPLFLHVGHSLGLQVEEKWILGDDPTVIEPGMVLNIELYSTSPQSVMIGDEETFVITAKGPEKISTSPVEMIEKIL
jgi:Xaa-Pro aminopeptidase